MVDHSRLRHGSLHEKELVAKGCELVDTGPAPTRACGSASGNPRAKAVTSIIHGKARQPPRRPQPTVTGTLSCRLQLDETDDVCNYIRHGGRKQNFGAIQGCLFAGLLSGRPPSGGGGQPNHDAAGRDRGSAAADQGRHDGTVCAGEVDKHFRFFDSICGATQVARTRWKNCCANRWTCCSSLAATTPPILPIWQRWAKPNCRLTSSRTQP